MPNNETAIEDLMVVIEDLMKQTTKESIILLIFFTQDSIDSPKNE